MRPEALLENLHSTLGQIEWRDVFHSATFAGLPVYESCEFFFSNAMQLHNFNALSQNASNEKLGRRSTLSSSTTPHLKSYRAAAAQF
jgi:hypothetical protein